MVRLADGREGWVREDYLTFTVPQGIKTTPLVPYEALAELDTHITEQKALQEQEYEKTNQPALENVRQVEEGEKAEAKADGFYGSPQAPKPFYPPPQTETALDKFLQNAGAPTVAQQRAGEKAEVDTNGYIHDPKNWENELYNNIKIEVDKLSPNLSSENRIQLIDAIILKEAEKLQKKYGTAYHASNSILSAIFSPGFHKNLEPLFREYPTKETEVNPYFEAAIDGFLSGFNAGLWSEASKGISSKGAGKEMNYFDDAQLKTEPKKSHFWYGMGDDGANTAANIAKQNGGVTLETTLESQGVLMPKFNYNDPSSVQAWRNASSTYASQASGEVRAIVGSNVNPKGIWNTVELSALKANPNVTRIILVDPVTQVETIIFTR